MEESRSIARKLENELSSRLNLFAKMTNMANLEKLKQKNEGRHMIVPEGNDVSKTMHVYESVNILENEINDLIVKVDTCRFLL